MPRKETFEDKVAKLNKLQSKIERYTVIAEYVLSVFGKDISTEEFIHAFDRIITDNRNKGFVEELKRNQQLYEETAS